MTCCIHRYQNVPETKNKEDLQLCGWARLSFLCSKALLQRQLRHVHVRRPLLQELHERPSKNHCSSKTEPTIIPVGINLERRGAQFAIDKIKTPNQEEANGLYTIRALNMGMPKTCTKSNHLSQPNNKQATVAPKLNHQSTKRSHQHRPWQSPTLVIYLSRRSTKESVTRSKCDWLLIHSPPVAVRQMFSPGDGSFHLEPDPSTTPSEPTFLLF